MCENVGGLLSDGMMMPGIAAAIFAPLVDLPSWISRHSPLIPLALKFIDIDEDEDDLFKAECSKEVEIMKKLDSRFVIRYYGSYAATKTLGGFHQDQVTCKNPQ